MTEDDVKDRAPDPQSFANAKKLADTRHWQDLGRAGNAIWGIAKGSSGHYAVYNDLDTGSLDCGCPSRKRPCKHALGLLLLHARGHAFPEGAPPAGHKWEAQERYQSTWE